MDKKRYETMFSQSTERPVFIPFLMVGDPTPGRFVELVDIVVAAGADALELGIPFSDPIADGPTVQAAAGRAIAGGTTPDSAFGQIATVRERHPDLPIGLLVYANLVVNRGLDAFYAQCRDAGVDSVLVADVPTLEGRTFAESAKRHGVDPVFIATNESDDSVLEAIAELGRGYTYVVTRRGVTGAGDAPDLELSRLVERLVDYGAPPPVFGFGISKPEHVAKAASQGARGVISGSAIIDRIDHPGDLEALVSSLANVNSPLQEPSK